MIEQAGMTLSAEGRLRGPSYTFLLDTNLGLKIEEEPVKGALASAGIEPEESTDLEYIDRMLEDGKPDIAFIPSADFHRLTGHGVARYRGLAIMTSKFTGETRLRNVLLVRKDDPAESLADLEGASYGYINKSCTSSYFPPALMLAQQGRQLDFLDIQPVKAWQGQIDSVVAGETRATMTMEDVWKSEPRNAETTKIIGRYDTAGPVVIIKRDVDPGIGANLLEALLEWRPAWPAIFGPFRPFTLPDVYFFFHELDGLPKGL